MIHYTRWLTAVGLGLAGWLVSAPLALAQSNAGPPRTVQDDAGMFSASAKEKANAQIAEIKRRFGKDVAVGTVVTVPRPKGVDKDNKEQVAQFFNEWAEQQFKNQGVNGILVLL